MGAMYYQQPASVYVAGDDAIVRDAIARLLALDPQLFVTDAGSGNRYEEGVVVEPGLLEDLQDVSLRDFIRMVKSMTGAPPQRHLRAVPNDDMRQLLSEREMQVVRLVAEGLSNKEISARLELSDKTVKNHISHILAKLNLSARTQVAVHALRAGIA